MNVFEWNWPGDKIHDADNGYGRLVFPFFFGWFAVFKGSVGLTSFEGFSNLSKKEGR